MLILSHIIPLDVLILCLLKHEHKNKFQFTNLILLKFYKSDIIDYQSTQKPTTIVLFFKHTIGICSKIILKSLYEILIKKSKLWLNWNNTYFNIEYQNIINAIFLFKNHDRCAILCTI